MSQRPGLRGVYLICKLWQEGTYTSLLERYHRCLTQWRIADNVCKHRQVGWTNEFELRSFGVAIMLEVVVEIIVVSRHVGTIMHDLTCTE